MASSDDLPRWDGLTMLRAAVDADLELIRSWRNHAQVRRASIMTAEITPEGHRAWWEKVSTDPGALVLIFEHAGTPAGVVTFKDHNPTAGTAEWGFFLDVDRLAASGELFAAWIELERAAVTYGFDVLGLAVLGGRTLEWNTSVLELHRRSGFVEVPDRGYTTEIDGVPQRVVWTELRVAGGASSLHKSDRVLKPHCCATRMLPDRTP